MDAPCLTIERPRRQCSDPWAGAIQSWPCLLLRNDLLSFLTQQMRIVKLFVKSVKDSEVDLFGQTSEPASPCNGSDGRGAGSLGAAFRKGGWCHDALRTKDQNGAAVNPCLLCLLNYNKNFLFYFHQAKLARRSQERDNLGMLVWSPNQNLSEAKRKF